jgi:tRNA Pseudouridine synthase II, C terminal
VGSFDLDDARTLERIEAEPTAAVLTPAEAMRALPRVAVGGEEARAVSHGAVFAAGALPEACELAGPFAVVDGDGGLLAVYERKGSALKAEVVMAGGDT